METHKIVHKRRTSQHHTSVIRPQGRLGDRARRTHTITIKIRGNVGSVDNRVCGCDQSHVLAPIVRLLGQVCIGLVAGVSGQPSAYVEKQAIGDGILVVITIVGRGNLPPETSTTVQGIPPPCLSVEHSLGQSQPLRLIFGGVGKCSFGGRKDGETPESLIVVTEGERLCRGFVVFVLTNLEEQSFGHDFVELGVTRVMPVVDPALNMSAVYQHCLPP